MKSEWPDAAATDAAVTDVAVTEVDAAENDATAGDATPIDATEVDATAEDAAPIDATEVDATSIDAFSCTAGTFERCEGSSMLSCNTDGTALETTDCGAPGCNATAGRCNTCVPSSATCSGATVTNCGADGLPRPDETCALSCTATPTAHCTYLQPVYLPDICDTPATAPSLVAPSTNFDTSDSMRCNGGVIAQAGGPEVCVVRYGTIIVPASTTMTFTGDRAVALVSDGLLDVRGLLDASASGTTGGPGSGVRALTALSDANNGAGGAGGITAGAAGGNNSMPGGGHAGGPMFDPLTVAALIGGQRAAQPPLTSSGGAGGGGGGALTLISCRGTVRVSGTIDIAGGGGNGGADQISGPALQYVGAGGGGAGGYVAIQGLAVMLNGEFYANGGGGGGGASNDSVGNPGIDGRRSTTAAAPGGLAPSGGVGNSGGRGGLGTNAPGVGGPGPSAGGGGGASGYFQTYTPVGVTATITPAASSPPFSGNRSTSTR